MDDDEQAAGREERGIEREERAMEVMELEDQIPRAGGRRVDLEIEGDCREASPGALGLGAGEIEAS